MDPTATDGSSFWAGVGLAAAIATALATGVSTFAAMWWRRQDRQRADFLALQGTSQWREKYDVHGDGGWPTASFNLVNVGDGVAYRAELVGLGCTVDIDQGDLREAYGPGHHQTTMLPIVERGMSLKVTVHAEALDWDKAELEVCWTESPTWKGGRRREFILLRDIAARPTWESVTDWSTHGPVPRDTPEPDGPTLPPSLAPKRPAPDGRHRRRLRR